MKIKSTLLAFAAFSILSVGSSQGAIIAQQDFETVPATPTLAYTTTTGTSQMNSGAVTGTFSPATSTWGVGASQGISFSTNVGAITFSPVNTTGLSDINLTLRLAALSINSTGNGVDGPDNFIVAISSDNGATFFDQIQVNGNTNATWSFSAGAGSAPRAYSTSAVTGFTPAGGGQRTADGFTNLSISGLPAVSGLVIRLIATDNDANENWLIDNVVVNAVPEPSTALLGALGALALLRRRR